MVYRKGAEQVVMTGTWEETGVEGGGGTRETRTGTRARTDHTGRAQKWVINQGAAGSDDTESVTNQEAARSDDKWYVTNQEAEGEVQVDG